MGFSFLFLPLLWSRVKSPRSCHVFQVLVWTETGATLPLQLRAEEIELEHERRRRCRRPSDPLAPPLPKTFTRSPQNANISIKIPAAGGST